MLAHIRTWLRRYWWTGPLVVLGLAVIWAILWPLTNALASHDVAGYATAVRSAHLQSAREAARTQLLTLGAGLFAASALFYTARNFNLARRQFAATEAGQRRTLELTEQGQVTERYTKAIEQLGSDGLDVRIGGIYALERIARDSARDHPTIIEVLSAFIREHSRERWPPPTADSERPERSTRPDVQAALTAIGRRNPEHDVGRCDLRDAVLIRANLTRANFTRADLTGADLTGANLHLASLFEATLEDGILAGAYLLGAVLARAILIDANLAGARLVGAFLGEATLADADLTGADLQSANLSGAILASANLAGANLTDANLAGAMCSSANLTDADLTNVVWPEGMRVPRGWLLDEGSGRLKRNETELPAN